MRDRGTRRAHYIAEAGVIAAVYAVLTVALKPIGYGLIQFRVSEAMCVLPFFIPAAIPGLTVGCLIANLFGGFGALDVTLGTAATLAAAWLSSVIKQRWLVPLPAVVLNAFAVGVIQHVATPEVPYMLCVAWVGLGQAVCCYALGMPLLLILQRYSGTLFAKNF